MPRAFKPADKTIPYISGKGILAGMGIYNKNTHKATGKVLHKRPALAISVQS